MEPVHSYVVIIIIMIAHTRPPSVSQTTHPLETDKLLIADRLVRLHDTLRTGHSPAVTESLLPAPVVIPAELAPAVAAVPATARALAGAAHRGGSQGAGQLVLGVFRPLRPAAALQAVLLPATVALLALLHHSVTADRDLGRRETTLRTQGLRTQHLADTSEAAGRELLVVISVPGGCPGVHDVVPVLSPGHTVPVSLRVVRGPEVVAHLVSHGDVRHCGGHRLAVVHQSDDPGVETLVAPAVVLHRGKVLRKYFRENYLSLSHPVFLTDTASILQVSGPGQAKGSSLEVSVGEHVGETEVVVVFLCTVFTSYYSQYLRLNYSPEKISRNFSTP